MDFSRCLYDPSDDRLLSKILKNNILSDEFGTDWGDAEPFKEKICRYIVLMYDYYSPTRLEFRDYWNRKLECAFLAGFDLDAKTGELPKPIEDVLTANNDAAFAAITKYMLVTGGMDYMVLWGYIIQLALITKRAFNGKSNTKDIADSITLRKQIDELTSKLFGGDEETEKGKQLLYIQIASRSSIRPEAFAKRVGEGDDLSDCNPYGEYEVKPLTFLGDEEPK